jgi:alpha-tubulin suppressor-like RCC1 family protein
MELPTSVRATGVVCKGTDTLLLLEDGRVFGCGSNDSRQLSISNRRNLELTQVELPAPAIDIAMSEYQIAVVLQNGSLYIQGDNPYDVRKVPLRRFNLGAVAVSLTAEDIFVTLLDGTVYRLSSILDNPKVNLPSIALKMISTHTHTLFLLDDGRVYIRGTVGVGKICYEPVQLDLPFKAVSITPFGAFGSFVLLENGSIWSKVSNAIIYRQIDLPSTPDPRKTSYYRNLFTS